MAIEADDYVTTDINSNITTAKKNVKLNSEKGQIEADQLTYDEKAGLANASGGVKLTTKDGVIIQADQLIYDFNIEVAKVSGKVSLTAKDGVIITAEQLDYNGISGLVTASSGVKLTTKTAVYQTETVNYNLKDSQGSFGSLTGTINAKDRNYLVSGEKLETANGITKITNTQVTRCEKPNPDYVFVAKETIFDGQYLHLKNVFLYIERIPVFYYPSLTLDVNNKNLPSINLGQNSNDGTYIKYEFSTPLYGVIDWHFKGELAQSDDYSDLGFGFTINNGNTKNYAGTYYNYLKGFWGIEDQFSIDTPSMLTTIDGTKDFSTNEKSQLGFSVTRKYWDSPLGKWQFGILGRRIYEYELDNGQVKLDKNKDKMEYGGIYGGYRLDYNPHPNITLSLLHLESFAGSDYGDLLTDFKIGSNWIYNFTVPLSTLYSIGINGNYNSDSDPHWIHQIYQINRETCCFKVSIGWDFAPQSLIFNGTVKF